MCLQFARRPGLLLGLACFFLLVWVQAACTRIEATPVAAVTATAQPTVTDTAEPTVTASATATFTPTATNTPTPTPTATSTPTASSTPTHTATPTRRPTLTPRPSQTPMAGSSGSSWDRYIPRTLAGIVAETADLLESSEEVTMYMEVVPEYTFPSRVRVIYTGQFRETPGGRSFFIAFWGSTIGFASLEEMLDFYPQEVLVTENGVEYWIPIQGPLIPYLQAEVQPGEEMVILVIWIGAIMEGGEIDRVFLINEFNI